MEKALLGFEVEIMKLGDCEDVMYGALMIGHICARGNSDVVHINVNSRPERFVLEDDIAVNVVHHRLKCCWRISESEVHNCWFEKSVSGFKCCFLFVSLANVDIVVPPSNIKLRIDVRVAKVAYKIRNQGKGVLVSNGEGIDLSIVLYRS